MGMAEITPPSKTLQNQNQKQSLIVDLDSDDKPRVAEGADEVLLVSCVLTFGYDMDMICDS
jgi:hypothetical protein